MNIPKSTFQVSRALTYSYFHAQPSQPPKPYILFLHGFPSLPVDFHNQISHLSNLGYGIIVPELLGYGDTSHPTESDPYRLKLMAGDVAEILDHHSIQNVLAVGHDWGAHLLTRFEFYHPDRVIKTALLAVSPVAFGQAFDIKALNMMMKTRFGYEGFAYQAFLAQDPEAAGLINSHQESFRCLGYAADPAMWRDHFGPADGLKNWILNDRKTTTVKGFDERVRREHEAAFSNEKGGYTGTLNWYKNNVFGNNVPDEKAELERRGLTTYQTTKPVLSILAAHDAIAVHQIQQERVEAYAPQVKVKIVDAGHWVMLEVVDTVSQELAAFFSE